MTSKRSLYHPAAQNSPPARHRKSLAQGRLIAENDPYDGDEVNKHSNVNVSDSAHDGADVGGHDPSTPRKSAPHSSFSHSPRSVKPCRALDVSDIDSDLNVLSGQRDRLQTSFSFPAQEPPEQEDIVLLDASFGTISLDNKEIPAEMSYVPSTAKVQRHKPAVPASLDMNSPRDGGWVDLARQVPVDQLPSMRVVSSAHDSSEGQSAGHDPRYKVTKVVPSKDEPGSAIVKAKPGNVVKITYLDEVGMPKENYAENILTVKPNLRGSSSEDSGLSQNSQEQYKAPPLSHHKKKSPRKSSVLKISKHTDELLPSKPAALSTSTSGDMLSARCTTGGKRKKKAPRYVASRYMKSQPGGGAAGGGAGSAGATAAGGAGKQQPMKATDRSVLARSSFANASAASGATRKTSSSLLKPRHTAPATSRGNTSAPIKSSDYHRTPEVRKKYSGGKASTPTTDSSTHAPEAVDLSAIGPPTHKHHSSFASPSLDESAYSTSGHPGARTRKGLRHGSAQRAGAATSMGGGAGSGHLDFSNASSSLDSTGQAFKNKQPREGPTTQLELDVLYARYIQWMYLASKAKKSFAQQEKHFMTTAFDLNEENQRLKEKDTEMRLNLNRIKHANELDHAIEIQEAGIRAVGEMLPTVYSQYSSLGNAIDTTRHHLPTKGVHLPEDELQFQAELREVLAESEQLLTELNVMTRPRRDVTDQLASTLDNMQTVVSTQVNELSRCAELVSAVNSLTTREASLKIQQL